MPAASALLEASSDATGGVTEERQQRSVVEEEDCNQQQRRSHQQKDHAQKIKQDAYRKILKLKLAKQRQERPFDPTDIPRSRLLTATLSADTSAMRDILKAEGARYHADVVNERDREGNAALHYAAGTGVGVVEVLLAAGARVNVANSVGFSPLHYGVMAGLVPVVNLMLKHGAWPSSRDNSNFTPLHVLATRKGPRAQIEEIATAILSRDPSALEAREQTGMTPMFVSAYTGNCVALQVLLAKGADASVTDAKGQRLGDVFSPGTPDEIREQVAEVMKEVRLRLEQEEQENVQEQKKGKGKGRGVAGEEGAGSKTSGSGFSLFGCGKKGTKGAAAEVAAAAASAPKEKSKGPRRGFNLGGYLHHMLHPGRSAAAR